MNATEQEFLKALKELNATIRQDRIEARERDRELAVMFKELAQVVSSLGDRFNGRAGAEKPS